MEDGLYKILSTLGTPFRYSVSGQDHISKEDIPAIFVSNHAKEAGPISIMLSFPLRLYPWTVSDMTEPELAPKYILDDFVKPRLHLDGIAGHAVSSLLTKLTVPLINGLGAVPVHKHSGNLARTFKRSMELLREGKSLLIFPEDPNAPADELTLRQPFMGGFALLAQKYYGETGRNLPIYPIAVEPNSKSIGVGSSEHLDLSLEGGLARQELAHRLEERVGALYLNLGGTGVTNQ
jgi:1-acyl-sn-glycerol-3-phosphate acyltransferase